MDTVIVIKKSPKTMINELLIIFVCNYFVFSIIHQDAIMALKRYCYIFFFKPNSFPYNKRYINNNCKTILRMNTWWIFLEITVINQVTDSAVIGHM